MKKTLLPKWLVAGVLVAVQGLSAPAQDAQPDPAPPSAPTAPQVASNPPLKPAIVTTRQGDPSAPGAKSAMQQPAGVDEILKLLQAGVAKDVIKTYIETAQVASPLSAADLVTLKEHGVPDELTVALMKRGAELTAQVNQ